MPVPVTLEQVRRFRMIRSGLLEPFPTPEDAAAALGGIQAQILPAAGVALWNRTRGLTHARFEQLLFDERTLVKLWGQRHTLHVYASRDWPLVCAMVSGTQSWWGREAEQQNRRDAHEQLVERVAAELRRKSAEGATMGRSDLRAAVEGRAEWTGDAALELDDHHLSPWGGLFAELVRRGHACHANREGEGRFVAREAWLPDLAWEPPDYETANLTLLRRYIRSYGPTTCEDFRYWRLVYAEPARRWWSALAHELVPITVIDAPNAAAGRAAGKTESKTGSKTGTKAGGKTPVQYVFADDLETLTAPAEDGPWPLHMLYRFDPLLLGHKDKSWIVAPAHYHRVWRPAGHIEGIVLVGGQAAATWRYARKGGKLHITVEPFGKVGKRLQSQVERKAGEVAAFFGEKQGDVAWMMG
jgi:hypothetical protein